MALDLSVANLLGVAAGALILLLGAFVLVARPKSALHRAFFLFAACDGLSTLAIVLWASTDTGPLQAAFLGTYWYFYIAFTAFLLGFALLFPRPILSPRERMPIAIAIGALGFLALATYLARPDLFWTYREPGHVLVRGPADYLTTGVAALATAVATFRLTHQFRDADGPKGARRQAAFVLGGMLLGFAPDATTKLMLTLGADPSRLFADAPLRVLTLHLPRVLILGALVVAAWTILRRRGDEGDVDRRFLLGAIAAVLAITALALLLPGSTDLLQNLALLAYPGLLAYAIIRYEVLDIDARLQRTAAISLTGVGVTVAFILVENGLQDLLREQVFGILPLAGTLAAIAAAALLVPMSRFGRRLAARLFPALKGESLTHRKLEIYRHSLEGALADGLLLTHESNTLAALRRSLGVTEEEHAQLMQEIAGQGTPATRPRTA